MFRLLAATLALVAFASFAAATTYDTTVRIAVESGSPPTQAAEEGDVALVRDDGDAWAWNVTLVGDYAVAEVRVRGVDVDRPKQILPEYDDRAQHAVVDHLHPHFFTEVPRDVADVDVPARIVNFTTDGDAVVIRLGLTGPGNATLLLRRDVAPPVFEVGEPRNVTHFSFLLVTRTDEFAFGDLRIRPAAGGAEVDNPTAVPALEQTFPVQGLHADTPYLYHVEFADWSGNVATSATYPVRTLPEPVRPLPDIIVLVPAPDSTVDPGTRIAATVDSPVPIDASGVRFFVDKREVGDPSRVSFVPDDLVPNRATATYVPPAPLAPGRHSVSVEVTNAEGGTDVARWTFEVAGGETPVPVLGALAALAVAAWRRR